MWKSVLCIELIFFPVRNSYVFPYSTLIMDYYFFKQVSAMGKKSETNGK